MLGNGAAIGMNPIAAMQRQIPRDLPQATGASSAVAVLAMAHNSNYSEFPADFPSPPTETSNSMAYAWYILNEP